MNKLFIITALGLLCFLFACNKSTNMKAEYKGDDITNNVSILRDKATKQASININTQGKWAVYAGSSVDDIDFNHPITEGSDSGTFPLPVVTDSIRSYFEVVTERGSAILAERHLPMTGGYNFRDLGGYSTADGRYVKWGKIFRSDELHNLTDADFDYLSAIPITSVVDFRSAEEIKAAPDMNPRSVKENYPYSIAPGNLMQAVNINPQEASMPSIDSLMMQLNILLVTDSSSIAQYKKFFQLLQNPDDVPLMFHCTAGKDRTGMGAALVLVSLGVDEKTIMEDYLLSNVYLADKYTSFKAENPELAPLFEVRPEFLKAGLDQIKQEYGSIENYLKEVLDVDIRKMRELYLY